jgi:hypothetical protein
MAIDPEQEGRARQGAHDAVGGAPRLARGGGLRSRSRGVSVALVILGATMFFLGSGVSMCSRSYASFVSHVGLASP